VSGGKPRAEAVFTNSSLAGIICSAPGIAGSNTAGAWVTGKGETLAVDMCCFAITEVLCAGTVPLGAKSASIFLPGINLT